MAPRVSIIIPAYNVEEYIEEMLESVQDQTFVDYEVIIINDGSTDGTKLIIDEFCKNDNRFRSYTQENQGVSSARNKGLDLANGEFVVFYDSDDTIPQRSLEFMYYTAKKRHAELVIGIMEMIFIHGPVKLEHTVNLGKTEIINKYDINILWTFSLANKIFKRSLIEEKKLRFLPLKHAEDGLFVIDYLFSCKTIAGCNAVTYQYRMRPFWETKSATQLITKSMLIDLTEALEKIADVINSGIDNDPDMLSHNASGTYESEEELKYLQENYKSNLYKRFIQASLLNGYYRLIWKSDEDLAEYISSKIEEYKIHMPNEMWKSLKLMQKDLDLDKPLKTKEELYKDPILTVIISKGVSPSYVERIVGSFYDQLFPSFVLWIQKELEEFIPNDLKQKGNILFIDSDVSPAEFKNNALKKVKSKYVSFFDENIFADRNTLLKMHAALEENPSIGFTSVGLKHLSKDNEAENITNHTIGYTNRHYKNDKFKYSTFDWVISNKVFKTDTLREKKITFTENPVKDTRNIYRRLKNKKVAKVFMYTNLSKEDISKKNTAILVKLIYMIENGLANVYKSIRSEIRVLKKTIDTLKKSIINFFGSKLTVRNKVLFISVRKDKELLENSKSLYDAVEGKKVIIAAKMPHSIVSKLRSMHHMFTSKVIVTDDYLKYFRLYNLKEEQKVIQIWHACGLFKKFGLDYLPPNIENELATHARYDHVMVSSEGVREGYAKAFGIDIDKVNALGVPRTDILYDEQYIEERKKIFYKNYPDLLGKKIVLYAPTFREEGNTRIEFNPQINWKRFSDKLADDVVILIKNHPVMMEDLLNGGNYNNIRNINDISTFDLMFVSDLLITDYSSIMFEYALLEKPMIFYCPDHNKYERDFYLKFPEDLPGDFTTSEDSLLGAINKALSNPDIKELIKFKEKYMSACDGHSAKRIATQIEDYIK